MGECHLVIKSRLTFRKRKADTVKFIEAWLAVVGLGDDLL